MTETISGIPSWIKLDSDSRTFRGNATSSLVVSYDIVFKAVDSLNATASAVLTVVVVPNYFPIIFD